ncbi:MAG: porin family protein [Campylobacterales bacterium]|nr:porin family protein [Campylobacterales bacterium]
MAPVEPEVTVPEVVESTPGSFYVGLGYSYMTGTIADVGTRGADIDVTGHALTALAGYNFNKYIAVEGRYSTVLSDVNLDDGTYDEDVNEDLSNFAIYLKPMYPVADNFNVYALLGYGQVSASFDGEDYSENGFQWGLGANYAVTENIGVFVDYTRLYDDTGFDGELSGVDVTLDSVNVGATYTF